MVRGQWRKTLLFLGAIGGIANFAHGLAFTAGNLVVSQFGTDGSGTALSSAAAPVYLKEFSTSGGPAISTLAMPTSVSGSHKRLVNSGSATSEGALTLSTNGQFLTLGGYDANTGTASIVGTGAARVIGVVDYNQNIDTTTALTDAFLANNIRSVVSSDGTKFWAAGTGTPAASGGVRYVNGLGATTSTQLSNTVTNMRVANISGNQLYASSASGAFQGVSTVGSGLPETAGQTTTLLPGFPTSSGPSSYDFFFSDADTVYVADDRSIASGGGLQRWDLSSGTWSLTYTLKTNLTAGLRGLTGTTNTSGDIVLYAITADSTSNKLVAVTDIGSLSPFSTLATAGANTIFRGVDFTPVPEPAMLSMLLGGCLLYRRRRA